MKTKLTFAALLGLVAFAFIFNSNSTENSLVSESTNENKVVQGSITQPVPDPLNGNLDKYYVGAINGEEDYHSYLGSPYLELDALKFNLWHQYVSDEWNAAEQRFYPASPFSSGAPSDKLMNPVSVYSGLINSNHDDINDHMNRKLLMMRPKIEYLLYGQRSDYQCEAGNYDPDLWFYAFNTHQAGDDYQDNTQYGSSQWVRRCIVNNNQTDGGAGWVVKSLRANTEQCKRFGKWSSDSCKWLIKPNIRIDSTVAHSTQNPLVCKIKVIGQDVSTELLNVDIHANDFRKEINGQFFYNGEYIEKFNFPSGTNLMIDDPWGDKFMWKARGYNTAESGLENNADIQVYWYGQCDMWIDYIRVDNDVADGLMNSNSQNFTTFNNWIKDEVELIGSHKNANNNETVALKYYMELCEFNNLPCMAYVNEKLKYWSNLYGSPGVDLVQVLTPDNMSFHVPWDKRTDIWNADFLNEHYIQKVNPSCLYSQSYPLNACYSTNQSTQIFSKIPETIQSDSVRILGKKVPVAEYEDWLQDNLDHKPSVWEGGTDVTCGEIGQWRGDFRSALEMCDALSKKSGKPFIFMPQAHQWWNHLI